ncbi:MAG: hypothetical protein ACRDM8_08690 [Gaiellaceae bacterium]
MASQLRLQVVLPIAVLGLLGLGIGAFAFGKPPAAADPDAVAANLANRNPTTTEAAQPAQPAKPKPTPKTPLERALAKNKVVVVLFYTPAASYDTLQTREARAGAQAGGAGFLALDVSKDKKTAALATNHDVRDAPAILVFARGPRVAVRLDGYADRGTVQQAALNAR